MDQASHNKIVSFIWGIADDVLRDLFKRGKYPDVILPICDTYLRLEEAPQSRIFPNAAFGYWKVTVERPLRLHKPGKTAADPLHGFYATSLNGKSVVVEYEPDPELRDTEQIAFLEAPPSGLPGGLPSEASAQAGIESFIRREVLPYTPDAWLDPDPKATKVGYEISFTRHFYQPPQLRTLAEISADILKLEQETEGLLSEITKGVAK